MSEAAKSTEENKYINLNLKNVKSLKLSTMDCKEELELGRKEAYIEPQVQKFLRILLQKGKQDIMIPSFDPILGFRYEIAESAFENKTKLEVIEAFLERLSSTFVFFSARSNASFVG